MAMQIEGRSFSAKELGFLATTMRGFDPKKSFGLSRSALKGSTAALVHASSTLAAATVHAMPVRKPGGPSAPPKTTPSTPKKPSTPAEKPSTPSKPGWTPGSKPQPGRPLE